MKGFPWRFAVYAVFLLYLLLDLRVCHGPLHHSLARNRDAVLESAATHRWVAVVNQEPLTSRQLDLAVTRHLVQRGKSQDEIPPKNLELIRRAVLQSLVDETLVRQYADGEGFSAPADEIDAFVEQWESQFSSAENLAERSERQRLGEEGHRAELARIWSRKRWLEQRIAPGVILTEEEAREWFEQNRATGSGLFEPEKILARHLLLRAVPGEETARENQIRNLHRQLSGDMASFADLVAANSEDPRTRGESGELNWFARDRVPEAFAAATFHLEAGEISEPFSSPLGWHIVEVLEKEPERPLTFEEVESEIRHHLENERTAETVRLLLSKLRRVARIRIFPENI